MSEAKLIDVEGEHAQEHLNGNSEVPAVIEPSFLDVVERLASRPDIDVAKIQQVLDMQEHVLDRQAKQEYNADMVKAQAEFPLVPLNGYNDHTKSPYPLYSDIVKTLSPVYTKHGFAASTYEGETSKENHIRTCIDVMHRGGWTETKFVDIPIDDKGPGGTKNKTDTHAKGSSLSYGKSYLARMVWNVATGEDDGNAAGGTASEFISEEEIKALNKKIKDVNADGERFLKALGIETLDTMPKSWFKKAMGMLDQKGREPGSEG